MRLGTCVAFELLTGIGIAAGIGLGATYGVEAVRDAFQREAQAATTSVAERGVPGRIQPVDEAVRIEPPALAVQPAMFEGVRDDILLAPLRVGGIARVKVNRGGSSISLRIDFDNGARAAFKPQQTNFQTVPRREVAAYRINRLLGLRSVAPAVGRRFSAAELKAAIVPEQRGHIARLDAEMITAGDGTVAGELSWWIPVIKQARVNGFRIDGVDGIVTWKRLLSVGNAVPQDDYRMVSQISDMVLFDHLINNSDRWTGGNARASDNGEFLYFMDNTLSFGISAEGHERAIIYLRRSQKFSRRLVQRLRDLSREQLRDALGSDLGPFDYLLTDDEMSSLLDRRDYALAYIDELIATYGDEAVLVFP